MVTWSHLITFGVLNNQSGFTTICNVPQTCDHDLQIFNRNWCLLSFQQQMSHSKQCVCLMTMTFALWQPSLSLLARISVLKVNILPGMIPVFQRSPTFVAWCPGLGERRARPRKRQEVCTHAHSSTHMSSGLARTHMCPVSLAHLSLGLVPNRPWPGSVSQLGGWGPLLCFS